MMAAKKVVWLGFMLLLVSAMLTPQMAAALEGAPAAPQAAFAQPLPDCNLKDVSGKDASYSNTLLDFQNNTKDMWYQVNQQPAGQTNSLTNNLCITVNGAPVASSIQCGPGTLSGPLK